ncbi:MAG: hypothetical protein AAFN51_14095, partial [Pseudomonadota bacterium]
MSTSISSKSKVSRSRGQQTPIEVVRIDDGAKRYGLISGFRRYMA